jgi:S1-C subfamily serine protease
MNRVTTLLLFTCIAGCTAAEPTSNIPSHDTAPTAVSSGVLIRAEGCRARPSRGAGAVIAPDRVVTVAHVVAGTSKVTVIDSSGNTHDAVVVGLDRDTDLAVLAVDLDVPPLPRRTLPAGEHGTFVVDRDGPTAVPFTTEAFVDIRTNSIDGDRRVERRGYQVSTSIVDGDSGAVLVTTEGIAIGVLYARSTAATERAWATDISEVEPLLDADTGDAVDVGRCVGVAGAPTD